ncbi:TlpA family protein disulfide reductase [Pedobacter mucosus]|uniref:TlpA family protein disulfide reductase n=1 Tax=Pedobacter mucosus TaxID=2895286 RepID=UPI001EE3C974|nr:TlpA disulfide reductase family protein [Pedobacter mucosus]UKT65054.1 TlpA family protein disulfide reductase [Pedobacter mucosus]
MKKSTIFIVLALLCLKFNVQSQTKDSTALFQDTRRTSQLELGAVLPEKFWSDDHMFLQNGKQFTKNLSEQKNKIIILDFWATWCSSCLKKLPLLDSIQKAYPEDIYILPIVSVHAMDRLPNVREVFQGKRKPFVSFTIPTLIEESKLWDLFPHHQIPHVIWIQNNRVLSMTGSDFINRQVIEKLIFDERAYKLKQAQKSK